MIQLDYDIDDFMNYCDVKNLSKKTLRRNYDSKSKNVRKTKVEIIEQFMEEYKKCKSGVQTANETMQNVNTKRTTFYKLVNEL